MEKLKGALYTVEKAIAIWGTDQPKGLSALSRTTRKF